MVLKPQDEAAQVFHNAKYYSTTEGKKKRRKNQKNEIRQKPPSGIGDLSRIWL